MASSQMIRGEAVAALPILPELLQAAPFANRALCLRQICTLAGSFDYAVAVPVRNEAALLGRMLSALGGAMRQAPQRGAAVFVVNDTQDDSVSLITQWARSHAISIALVDTVFAPEIRNAPHARRLALDLAAYVAPEGMLLTTDADSHVGPGWVDTYLTRLAMGADFVCEDVRLDEDELTRLPDSVRRVGEIERAYFNASEQLWHRWTGGRAGPFAIRASGASMAMRTAAYLAVGRLPTPVSGEDSALCAAMLAAGLSVECLADIGTRTSARLEGRTTRGCGDALAQRARLADPPCDAALVPIATLRKRALAFTCWTSQSLESRLHPAGNSRPSHDRSRPMRASELESELELALTMLRMPDNVGADA
ncbi:glycosyltransferase [Erythrobacter sp. 3-20A1M]|nr:glycosyltransferase [Erythrobacter sp. 3-20A1M]